MSVRIQQYKDLRSKSSTVPAFILNLYLCTKNSDNFHCYCSMICISLHDPNSLPTYIYTRIHTGGGKPSNSEESGAKSKTEQKKLVTRINSRDVTYSVVLHLIQPHIKEPYSERINQCRLCNKRVMTRPVILKVAIGSKKYCIMF